MTKEEILIAIKEIQCRYSLPALERNFTEKDYACKQYEKLVIHLANQQEQKDLEIERLTNIINELENYLNEDDWSSVNGEVAIKLIKNKIKELKGEDK